MIMALPRKKVREIEELRSAAIEIREILKGLKKKEASSGQLIADLENLVQGYDKRILSAVYEINVK